jgi:hypothetical protein
MRMLYKYPQRAFPYADLVETNRARGRGAPEYELIDTGAFDESRYFDVFVEYAKADAEDLLMRITVVNRGPGTASLHVLPTVWFRNTWDWRPDARRPSLRQVSSVDPTCAIVRADTTRYGARYVCFDDAPDVLFTDNVTNARRCFGSDTSPAYAKDGINDFVVDGIAGAVNPARVGTKAAAHYVLEVPAGGERVVKVRFTPHDPSMTTTRVARGGRTDSPALSPGRAADVAAVIDQAPATAATATGPFDAFDAVLAERQQEADAFYATVVPASLSADEALVMRQALAGMLWSKQYYHYDVKTWLHGDPGQPPPPSGRERGRNHEWTHLYNADILSMPDTWEYPWYAAWDLAFHCLPLALVDSDFAKEQLVLMLREWYMHPNGQLPAYEWAFGDVNPPVHAWAAWRVYKIDKKQRGTGDRVFLERVFQKLLLNFTWWVNRKDASGRNVFEGGFLGLDNMRVFDRSGRRPRGGRVEQSDGTSRMAMYSLNLPEMALELARENPAYEDVASKFWEHFLHIAHAMSGGRPQGDDGHDLWDDEDGFFYDVLHLPDGARMPLRVRSLVGLIPLLAIETLDSSLLERMQGFTRRLNWFVAHRPDLTENVACMRTPGNEERRLLSILDGDRLRRVLRVMLDEREFLSPHGIRSVSALHRERPYALHVNGSSYVVRYEPAESTTGLFGGNSNWRGPVWFPINYLLIEALQEFHHYFGDDYRVECPTGSGQMLTLAEVARELSQRLARIFLRSETGERPVFGADPLFAHDPHWRDLVLFHEYFHGDSGAGVGASHQTGWTALVAKLLQQSGEGRRQ